MMAVWLGILTVSVLGHELGHALVARRMGANVSVQLHGWGGVTSWSIHGALSPWRRMLIAAAGSLVGLAMGGLAWLVASFSPGVMVSSLVVRSVRLFVTANLFWGFLNWLPIRPLDGGHIFAALLETIFGARSQTVADVAFPLLTIGIGYFAWLGGYPVGALLAVLALASEVDHRRKRRGGRQRWQRDGATR